MYAVWLGLYEWLTWIVICYYGLKWYNNLLLWLWFLTAELQRKMDDDVRPL